MRLFYPVIVFVCVLLDQLTKSYISKTVEYASKIPVIERFFYISNVHNYGAGFSILQNARVFLSAVSILVICALAYMLYRSEKNKPYENICYILILSGALGNLIDRIRFSYVVDFLDFYIFGYNFPVFNVADCFITVGCFLLLIISVLGDKNAED